MICYDIIGDVHGCAKELKELLGRLGYARDGEGVYRHPERTVVFIGDLVDRGPGQLEVLEIAKAMVDAGTAQMVMGNHEFNAICFAIPDPDKPGEFLRKHTGNNVEGHSAFTTQLTEEQQEFYLAPAEGSEVRIFPPPDVTLPPPVTLSPRPVRGAGSRMGQ